LVNSNPATIMTDPGMADVTYLEPLTLDAITEIIRKERPDALLTVTKLLLEFVGVEKLTRILMGMVPPTATIIALLTVTKLLLVFGSFFIEILPYPLKWHYR